jgi:uncharacterized protein (DUF1499 family)
MQFVDDVEFWFPPGNRPIVQYRSASRSGFVDFSANKKRVKVKLFTYLNEAVVIPYIVHDMMLRSLLHSRS